MRYIRALYIRNLFFQVILGLVSLFILGFFFSVLYPIAKALFFVFLAALLVDLLLLYGTGAGIKARRFAPEKLSNGDENEIRLFIENHYPFDVRLNIIDEVPRQFQMRNMNLTLRLGKKKSQKLSYHLRPVKRGDYQFGHLNVFASSPVGFFSRRLKEADPVSVPVYPSYIQLQKFQFFAISNRLVEYGIKKIRRIGHNQEFEQIKEYVRGDDFRTVNWKATARKGELMVNSYQDERSQQVYCLIDKGRAMKMPFNGMSLLDYAINASLVLSNVAIAKDDKAGLITFQHKVSTTLPASKNKKQMYLIMETLYNQKTAYRESDVSSLFTHVKRSLNQRSLLLLFTNFESLYGLERQLPYLRKMAKDHLLVVIFFENTEITRMLETSATDLKEVYYKTMAEKFVFDKKVIVKELQKHGIQTLLTPPELLTVNSINKYLEIKARGLI